VQDRKHANGSGNICQLIVGLAALRVLSLLASLLLPQLLANATLPASSTAPRHVCLLDNCCCCVGVAVSTAYQVCYCRPGYGLLCRCSGICQTMNSFCSCQEGYQLQEALSCSLLLSCCSTVAAAAVRTMRSHCRLLLSHINFADGKTSVFCSWHLPLPLSSAAVISTLASKLLATHALLASC
jgi:hypothetical protein